MPQFERLACQLLRPARDRERCLLPSEPDLCLLPFREPLALLLLLLPLEFPSSSFLWVESLLPVVELLRRLLMIMRAVGAAAWD